MTDTRNPYIEGASKEYIQKRYAARADEKLERQEALVSLRAPEVRTFTNFEIRDVDGTESGSHIEGLAVPYGEWYDVGWFMEQFELGTFARSIKEAARNAPLLLWHDNHAFPAGKAVEWNDTEKGLRGVWEIDQSDALAVEATRKAREGFLTGLSVGFAPIAQDTMTDDKGLMWVTRTEARLLEVSLTPTPAYAGARVSLVRSRVQHQGGKTRSAELDSWRAYLEGIKR